MESREVDANLCNGNKHGADMGNSKGGENKEEDEDYAETKSLLPSAVKGGMLGRKRRKARRKVQWNDHNGDKLVEVLEFQPSDSSDSDDDFSFGLGFRANIITSCISFCCCLGSQRPRS